MCNYFPIIEEERALTGRKIRRIQMNGDRRSVLVCRPTWATYFVGQNKGKNLTFDVQPSQCTQRNPNWSQYLT
ncbi:hypothetical protein EUGRSUZ_C01138 [Eucalyptus grandis]|uniref:Uncharacterized protein n=2 Tax=Eucalyptus grandis TaxID=71139 RepID=A0ACC3LCV3_EUCGR|nr:hypothetical protein EUGRSUZ_C01138 [Eucalyptus grandis]